jgi:hypothetical protein
LEVFLVGIERTASSPVMTASPPVCLRLAEFVGVVAVEAK